MTNNDSNLFSDHPIGIFDSGIGGLTVANAIRNTLPNEQIIYFGDTAHLPYGDKASYSIKHYSTEITKFLLQKKCKIIVIACHTASSTALEEVREVAADNAIVIDVVSPVIKLFHDYQDHHKIGVIGTKGTIHSNIYSKKIHEVNEALKVASLATPLLCPMIEEGFINDDISQAVIDNYLTNSELEGIQSIILACTHYPLIKKQISKFYSDKIEVLDSAEITALHVKNVLRENGLLNDSKKAPHHFYVSDYTKSFEESTRYFFKEEIQLEKGSIWS